MQTRSWTYRFGLAVLVLALLAVVTGVTAPRAGAFPTCDPPEGWGQNRADLASTVVRLINDYRLDSGLGRLALSPALAASSRWKSLHMTAYGTFAHEDQATPVSRSAHQRALDCGYRGTAWGENIAYGYTSARAVVAGWLASAGHRANIDNPGFTSTGVGVAASGSGTLYWTQSFGDDASALAAKKLARKALLVSSARVQIDQVGTGRFVASIAFVYRTTGLPLTAGSVACRARVAGKALPVIANTFKGASTLCAWGVPAWAHGAKLAGRITVAVGGRQARHHFVRTIR